MVAVADPVQVIDRRRIDCIHNAVEGARQPYHYVKEMERGAAEQHLARCAAMSGRLAVDALRAAVSDLAGRDFEVSGAAIVEAAGRRLPDLAGILASHALIHTAEGQFFRTVFRRACESLAIPVTSIRERDLSAAPQLRDRVQSLGRTLGPPWTQDQKSAAQAACMVLSSQSTAGV